MNKVVYVILDETAEHRIGQGAVVVDWDPAYEHVRFKWQRGGGGAAGPAAPRERRRRIEPVWHGKLARPYLDGFRAVIETDDGDLADRFPNAYLEPGARQVAAALVDQGSLDAGARYTYLACAFDDGAQAPPPDRPRRFSFARAAAPPELRPEALPALLQRAEPSGQLADEDVIVFVPQRVLDEATAALHDAGENETGGALVGHLCRDAIGGTLFARVTAQLPAEHTEATATRLTFTARTWSSFDGVLGLRRAGEQYLGWWHTHPARAWCAQCPEQRRRACTVSGAFFSDDDAMVHRSAFSAAYGVALVVCDSHAHGISYPMFGWRQGILAQRGYHVLAEDHAQAHDAAPAATAPRDPETRDDDSHDGKA